MTAHFKQNEATLPIPECTLGRYLLERLRLHGSKKAQYFPNSNTTYTYEDILTLAVALATHLAGLGVKRGDSIVVVSDGCEEYPIFLCAVLFMNAVIVPLNPYQDKRDLTALLDTIKPKLIFVESRYHDEIVDVASSLKVLTILERMKIPEIKNKTFHMNFQVDSTADLVKEQAVMMVSSGGTGTAHCIMHSHNQWHMTLRNAREQGFPFDDKDVLIQYLAPSCFAGFFLQMANIDIGVYTVVLRTFDVDLILDLISSEKATVLFATPRNLTDMAKHPKLSSINKADIKHIVVGGAVLTPELEAIVAATIEAPICQWYGSVECHFIAKKKTGGDYGSCGQADAGVEIKILNSLTERTAKLQDIGEILVRTSTICLGYVNNMQSFSKLVRNEGWVYTRDIGYLDKKKNLFVVDRMADLIVYRGNKISPTEIECILISHRGIKEVAVIGVYNMLGEEQATAFVVRNPEAHVTEDELLSLVKARLPETKWLHGGIHFLAQLPRTHNGTLKKKALREEALRELVDRSESPAWDD